VSLWTAARRATMYRQLDPDRIVETTVRLQRRIEERFPDADLCSVARELVNVARGAPARAEQIERPIRSLRVGLGVVVLALIVVALTTAVWVARHIAPSNWSDLAQGLDAAINLLVLLGAALLSLVTVERQLKRRTALRALHELRVLAHVVELHQLTKDPDRLIYADLATPSSPMLAMTSFELMRYLDYCSEMLAVIGNLSAVYAMHLDDAVVLDAVDAIESLTAAISQKIWQKIQVTQTVFGSPTAEAVMRNARPR
jgi:hypothetical protein